MSSKEHPQQTVSWDSLPAEIRNKIYDNLLEACLPHRIVMKMGLAKDEIRIDYAPIWLPHLNLAPWFIDSIPLARSSPLQADTMNNWKKALDKPHWRTTNLITPRLPMKWTEYLQNSKALRPLSAPRTILLQEEWHQRIHDWFLGPDLARLGVLLSLKAWTKDQEKPSKVPTFSR